MNYKILLPAIIFFSFLLFSCKKEIRKKYFTDIEIVTTDGKFFQSSVDSMLFSNSKKTLTNEKAFSGKNSVKIDKSSPFALGIEIKDIIPGERIIASIWRTTKGKGFLVIENPAKEYYFKSDKVVETNSEGWERIELDKIIPEDSKTSFIKMYIWNPDTITTYYDNFTIERIRFE